MPTTPLEWCLALTGLVIGVLYAFDGWSSSSATKSLKDSPRLLNFKYAAGAFFITFIADFSKLGITDDKGRLLAVYLGSFAVTSILAIAAVAGAIGFQFRRLARNSPGMQFAGPHPVLHFLMHGYRSYEGQLKQTMEDWRESQLQQKDDYEKFIHGFLPEYNKQVTRSIAAINHALNNPTPEVRRQTARNILVAIEAVVMAYHKRREGLKIGVNYMRACRCAEAAEDLKARVRFREGEWADFDYLLVLEQYTDDQAAESFALPVRKDAKGAELYLLPGAPAAFFMKSTIIVDDTRKITLPKNLSATAAREIREYFARKAFKSFMSMTIIHNASQCGVLNIEASHEYAFGKKSEDREAIASLVSPLCHLLGFLIKT